MTANIYLVRLNGVAKYVGFTTKSIECRWKEHCNCAIKGSRFILHKSIRKHGKDAFTVESIYTSEDAKHTLTVMEPKFILEHKTFYENGNGYNMTLGGEGNIGYTYTEETRKKMSCAQMGRKRPPISEATRRKLSLAGKGKHHHSEETRKKISLANMGRYGKPCSEDTRRKMSKAKLGKPCSEDTRRKMSFARLGMKYKKFSL